MMNTATWQCVLGEHFVYFLTLRASSGTVSSPLTTVNRLVCETSRLRKYWLQLWCVWHTHTHILSTHRCTKRFITAGCKFGCVYILHSKTFGIFVWINIYVWAMFGFSACFWNDKPTGRGVKAEWFKGKVKGYHTQTLTCPPASEWCTSAPGYGHHLQKSAKGKKARPKE